VTLYVLDASAGADLLLDTNVGRRLLPRIQSGAQWWVPEHYFVEVASVVRRAALGRLISQRRARDAMRLLVAAPLRRVQVRPLLRSAWERHTHLTMYDALYVVLAEHLGAALVTSDLRLAGCPQLNVPLVAP